MQFTFQIIQTLKRLWSHVHHYTFFTIFRDSLCTSFQYSWTWKVQLGASHPCQSSIFIIKFLVVSQSQVSLFVSCITSIPPQISSENNKKQFISTIIKNSMQTVEVKSTSSHNCLSQNDDATLNSWSQVLPVVIYLAHIRNWNFIQKYVGQYRLPELLFWFRDANNR